PRWMLDKYPDMLAVDEQGRKRKFGSRRHYCFSHKGYKKECARIANLLGQRYGTNPYVCAFQTDNEYGCHDTTRSYSKAALLEFRNWLAQRYRTIEALNQAWGNIFWSMQYNSFDQIELPNLTVTEANPAHQLAFKRFSSDQVVAFNKVQVDQIRKYSNAPVLHNYMGRIVDFDHYKVGADMDIAGWDSYPIGFLSDRLEANEAHKKRFLRQGDPDMQAFHHDLYRAVGRGRLWVMEQQPGPVNWAPYNPAPLGGMVRLWSWEAFAHGAENVCYFRWRQAPFAQEQMHAGLLRSDGVAAPALAEIAEVAREIKTLPKAETGRAEVALIFDYQSCWAWQAEPQGADFDMFALAFSAYRALRQAGLSIDIVPPDIDDLSAYRLVLAPGLMAISEELKQGLARFKGLALIGPRSGLKTDEFSIAEPLGPNLDGLETKVTMVQSLPPGSRIELKDGGGFERWFEHLETGDEIVWQTKSGQPGLVRAKNLYYLAGWPDEETFKRLVLQLCSKMGIATLDLPAALRVRDTATQRFYFNYASDPVRFENMIIPAAGVIWREIG
ncbi:Beta-galactosidase, LacA family, partial [hydrothermal vent metagenome]